jgi:hypothetical protein
MTNPVPECNMARYFTRKQDGIERAGKVAADIFCTFLILTASIVYLGVLGGLLAFVILNGAIVGAEYLMPNEDDAPGMGAR